LIADGVPSDAIDGLAYSPLASLYDDAVGAYGFTPMQAAIALWRIPRRLQREGISFSSWKHETLRDIFSSIHDGALTFDALLPAMRAAAMDEWDRAALEPRLTAAELTPIIQETAGQVMSNGVFDVRNIQTLTLDILMDNVRGRIPGHEAAAAVKDIIQEKATA
jgi:Glu-tRNA(Gln) amidotransferase subunit E-like FAD-binding protein